MGGSDNGRYFENAKTTCVLFGRRFFLVFLFCFLIQFFSSIFSAQFLITAEKMDTN